MSSTAWHDSARPSPMLSTFSCVLALMLTLQCAIRGVHDQRRSGFGVCSSKTVEFCGVREGRQRQKRRHALRWVVPLDTNLSGVVFRSLTRLSFILSLIGDTLGFCIRTTS